MRYFFRILSRLWPVAPGLLLAVAAAGLAREPADAAKLLQAAHIATDEEGVLKFLRQQIPTTSESARLSELVRQLGAPSFAVRERACVEAIALGPKAVHRLQQALKDGDPEVRTRTQRCLEGIQRGPGRALDLAAIRVVKERTLPHALGVLLDYLPFAMDDGLAQEALGAMAAIVTHGNVNHSELNAALHDRSPERRGAAAFLLAKIAVERPDLRQLLCDPDPEVRLRCAQGLLEAGDLSVVPQLIVWLNSGPPILADRAEDVLAWLAEGETPVAPITRDDAARQRRHDAWAAWWKANEEHFQLPTAEADPLIDLQALSARRAAQQFVNALGKGQEGLAIDMMGAPFLYKFGRHNSVLEFGRVTRRLRAEYRMLRPSERSAKVMGVTEGTEYAERATPSERDFLRCFPIGQIRIVTLTSPERGRPQERIFFVYLGADRPRIVGYGYG